MSIERMTFTVEEAGIFLGIGKSSAYEAVKTGVIPSIRIGRRILVPRSTIATLLHDPNTKRG